MSTTYDILLSRLEGVRKSASPTGIVRSHRARCPSHGSRGRTLSIAEKESGVILLKCFYGCTHTEIAVAVGLTEADLFPPRDSTRHHSKAITNWEAAAAAADAVVDLALDVIAGVMDADLRLIHAAVDFRRLAKAAMMRGECRQEGRRS